MMVTMQQQRTERIQRTLEAVRQVAAAPEPIVVGPWLGEIGFELLYWIPFLRWAFAETGITPDRVCVVSRGGCGQWYGELSGRYVELFDSVTPDELRTLTRERMAEQAAAGPDVGLRRGQMTAKQYGMTRAEGEILRRVGFEGATLLHPSLMFSLFRMYWRQRIRNLYDYCARVQPLAKPAPYAGMTGPYVAVKFYSSQANPDRAGAVTRMGQIVERLADVTPVVVLDSGSRYDDHGAFPIADSRVTVMRNFDPRTNLAEQTAIIAHASAFVGTYGGFAYLAPMLGVPTTALYGDRNFRDDHLQIASKMFGAWGVRFDVWDVATGLAKLQRDARRWTYAAA